MKAVLAFITVGRRGKLRRRRGSGVLIERRLSFPFRLWRHGAIRARNGGGGRARGSRDKRGQGGTHSIEIDAWLFLGAGPGFETRLLVAKTIAPLSLRPFSAGTVVLLSKATIIAGLAVLAVAIAIGGSLLIPVLSLRPFVRLCIKCRSIEIRLWLAVISHRPTIWLGRRKGRSLGRTLQGGGKPVRQGDEIIVFVAIVYFFAVLAIAQLGLLLRGLGGRDDAKIMFGVLQIAFGHHGIARGLRVASQLQIFFSDMLGRATNFHVRAVRFIGPRQRTGAFSIVSTAHTFVLTGSH